MERPAAFDDDAGVDAVGRPLSGELRVAQRPVEPVHEVGLVEDLADVAAPAPGLDVVEVGGEDGGRHLGHVAEAVRWRQFELEAERPELFLSATNASRSGLHMETARG